MNVLIIPKIKDDFPVLAELLCFGGHPVARDGHVPPFSKFKPFLK